jgi:phenylpropionate dioxygenase-like ring-hydroxylating dioxygenase large terminal subunit
MNVTEKKYKYFPASWYPIFHSDELRKGQSKVVKAFSGEFIMWRGHDGTVGAVMSHCPHMGTHFKGGKVEGNNLVCPLHLRKYGTGGKCTLVPGSDKIPENAHTQKIHVHEDVGIIFVFLGKEIAFPFPEFPRAKKDKAFAKASSYYLNTPYQALLFNGFDTHHLGCIHNRSILTDPVFKKDGHLLTGEYSMGVIVRTFYDWLVKTLSTERNDVYLECYGGNFLVITNKKTNDNILITSFPVTYQQSRIFLTAVTENKDSHFLAQFGQWLRLAITTYMGVKFLEPDIKIIDQMRPDLRNFYSTQDKGASVFWDYWDDLPRDEVLQDSLRI